MFSKRLIDYCVLCLQVSLLCSFAAQSSSQLEKRCSGPYEPGRCQIFRSTLNVTQSSNIHCSSEHEQQGSLHRPPVIPGHCNSYSKIKCQAPRAIFQDLSIDRIRCSPDVEHFDLEPNVTCTLVNGSDFCWQMSIYIRVSCHDSEVGNMSDSVNVIPLYGIRNADHNSEHYCIYIRPENIMTTCPEPSTSLSPSTIFIAESTATTLTKPCSAMISTVTTTLITTSVLSLSPSTTSYLHHSVSSSISGGDLVTSRSCSTAIQSPSSEETISTHPTVMIGSLALTTNGLTTVSVLGAALIVVSSALVISCVCNVLICTRKQDRQRVAQKLTKKVLGQKETGPADFAITNKGFEDSITKLSDTPYQSVNTV